MELLELVRGKKLMVGAIDVASPAVETPQDVATTLRNALQFVDPDQLWPSTNCGMAPLPRTVARAKLAALGAGAEIVRRELSERSEEHTSELQSRGHLVCRLLLEKKNISHQKTSVAQEQDRT